MNTLYKSLACLTALISIFGCGFAQPPIEMQLSSTSYAWGDRVTMEFYLKEPPAGVTSEVSIFLVGYQSDPKSADLGVPVLEQMLASLGFEAAPGYWPVCGLKSSLPASSLGMTKLNASSSTPAVKSTIRWAIVARDGHTGFETAAEISIR